jgi:hypothetical protein
MRLYGITASDLVSLIASENRRGVDERGNLIYVGTVRAMRIGAVLACDDLDTVITVYDLDT